MLSYHRNSARQSYFHHFASGADEESEAMKIVYATCPKSHSYCFLIFLIIINFLLFFYIFSFPKCKNNMGLVLKKFRGQKECNDLFVRLLQ